MIIYRIERSISGILVFKRIRLTDKPGIYSLIDSMNYIDSNGGEVKLVNQLGKSETIFLLFKSCSNLVTDNYLIL